MAFYHTTALGRMVPASELGTVLEDLVLKVLHDFRMSPFNRSNAPLDETGLADAANLSPQQATALAESLARKGLVEQAGTRPPAFRISGSGVVFVMNLPQGIPSFS